MGVGVLACGCGPRVVDGAEFEEECGGEGPVQLLQLDPDERVLSGARSIARQGDRFLVVIGRYDVPLNALTGLEDAVSVRVASVDVCGGDERTLLEGVDGLFPPMGDGQPWLACSARTGDVMAIDPNGDAPAEQLGRSAGCVIHPLGEQQWVALSQDDGNRELAISSPEGLSTIADDVVHLARSADGHHLLYSTMQEELWEYDGSTSTLIAEGVVRFTVSDDGQAFAATPELDPLSPATWTVFRRDGSEGPTLPEGALRYAGDGFAVESEDGQIVYDGEWNVLGPLPDGRLAASPYDDAGIVALSPDGSEPETLLSDYAPEKRIHDGSIWAWVHDRDDLSIPFPSTVGQLVRTGLWRATLAPR